MQDNRIENWLARFIADFGRDMLPLDAFSPASSIAHLSTVKQLQIHSRIVEFIGLLADILSDSRAKDPPSSSVPLQQVQIAHEAAYLMESHATFGIKIQDVANRLNVHRSYLNVVFKKTYGISPMTYLTHARMRAAKKLLQETEWSIEEIAERLAFSSFGHFSRAFKAIAGLSPKAYRNHQRKAIAET